ncbi:MAG: hypothetical protein FWH08_07265 [Oscillospiraceae bacterium]|nr:hypothetical protein [Oscillospiraceae bacterium]
MWGNRKTFIEFTFNYFGFLKENYDMHIVDTKYEECIKFESKITWLELWYDRYSLFVEIGTNDGRYQISLLEIMQFVMGSETSVSYTASDDERLKNGLQFLSDFVKTYAHKALLGDIDFFKEIEKNNEKNKEEIGNRNNLNYIEELAKAAWEKRDYYEVIKLYTPILKHLSETQIKRLNLCKKMI